ncbi:MAG: T9SS type A sorting domain-containing protein [Chlorobiota bacterium]|nr:MAG: T9SS type A sorting domain-containing protein [Chlorobiota bacterium]
MKFLFYFLVLFAIANSHLLGQSTDTIKVLSHKDVIIQTDPSKGSTSYPQWVNFPKKGINYRRVIGYLTFECPPNLNCGEWDYGNHIYIGKKGGVNGENVNWEIGRFITPYGNYWKKGNAFKHGWYYDFTDFALLLHDSVEIIYQHSGYEAKDDRGWKINLTFYCIEGTPIRTPISITNSGYTGFSYGDPNKSMDSILPEKNIKLQPETNSLRLLVTQTGHGNDKPDGCGEFCGKLRTILFDKKKINDRFIWRECGFNPLFPQAGTWLYDRANWCPGASVPADVVDVMNLKGGTEHSYDVDMEKYVSTASTGNYDFSLFLIEYSRPLSNVDASIEAIVAPSKEYEYLRQNPICGNPTIIIKNNGNENLTYVNVKYGLKGIRKASFKWKGNLKFGESDTVKLTEPFSWASNIRVFEVELVSVNNPKNDQNLSINPDSSIVDEYLKDNVMTSTFDETPVLPGKIIILLKTNNAATENYYYIRDAVSGEILFEKNNLENVTTYRDTIDLPSGKCYNFEFYDDGPPPSNFPLNKDGLSWWANTNDGAGYVRILSKDNKTIKNFQADFGTKFFYQFTTNVSLDVKDFPVEKNKFLYVFPNPSSDKFNIEYFLNDSKGGNLEVFDLVGNKVFSQTLIEDDKTIEINLSSLIKGNYILKVKPNNGTEEITKKIVIL